MNNNYKVMKGKRKIGEPSSKYGYDPSAFEKDIEKHHIEYEQIYAEFVEWIKTKNLTPKDFRQLFIRYYEEFIK